MAHVTTTPGWVPETLSLKEVMVTVAPTEPVLWTPRHVLVTASAQAEPHGRAILGVELRPDEPAAREIQGEEVDAVLALDGVARLPLAEAREAQRAAAVEQNVGPVAPGVVQYTSDPLFQELWRRPALAPRDRSLVTVSALISAGQVAQVPFHLNRAMDNGLTKAQASEVLTHLLFYAGWPNVMSFVPKIQSMPWLAGGRHGANEPITEETGSGGG